MGLRILDLCAGIGGFSYAAEYLSGGQYETAAFVEIDKHCQAVLAARWQQVPIYDDIKEYNYDKETDGHIDILCAGYPCQPFATSGHLKGESDPRHLWPDVFRVVQAVKPQWCIFENVPNHINMGFSTVQSDMEAQGYTVQALVIPAIAADANQIRHRLWIICTREAAENKGEKHYHKLAEKLHPGVKMIQTPDDAKQARNLYPTPLARDCNGKVINDKSRLPNAVGDGERERLMPDNQQGRKLYPTPVARDAKGKGFKGGSLPIAVGHGDRERLIWRTPDTGAGGSSYEKLSKGITHRESGQPIQMRLEDQLQLANGTNAPRINPDWLEWHMGYPTGWTNPEETPVLPPAPLDYDQAWESDPHPDKIHQLTYNRGIRAKRVRSLGNAIVPRVAARFFRIIAQIEGVYNE